MGLLRQARPILDRMVEECNETAYVAIFKENHIVYLDVVETNLTVRVVSRVGSRLPAYCTASGKAHLAFMSDEEFESTLAEQKLVQHTPTTLADIDKLKAELEQVRSTGYALDNEELDSGVRCIAAPIRDYTRRIVGAVSISGPSMRLDDKRLEEELIPMILRAGEDLSTRLGFPR
jgi:DNA-binding IclR family transcriptional regulator